MTITYKDYYAITQSSLEKDYDFVGNVLHGDHLLYYGNKEDEYFVYNIINPRIHSFKGGSINSK